VTKAAELGRAGVNGVAQSAAMKDWEKTEGHALRPVAEDLRHLQEAAGELEHLLQKSRDNGPGAPGRTGFMIRAITSLATYGANLLEEQGKHSAEEAAEYVLTRENRRDRINADNLKWLIDEAYVGRKIMVWAHNAHVMNAWYTHGFDSVSLQPLTDGMKSMGVWLSDWYGNALYKIGLTAYQGSDGWVGGPPEPVPPAPSGSLEERLHRLGAAEVFVPLRGNNASGSLPAQVISIRIPKYKTEMIAIDTMKPATLI